MRREYVIPGFLAAVTADALLAGRPSLRVDEPAAPQRERRPMWLRRVKRWVRRVARHAGRARSPVPVQLSFDDEWAGSWYARARRRFAAALRRSGSVGLAAEGRRSSAVPGRKSS